MGLVLSIEFTDTKGIEPNFVSHIRSRQRGIALGDTVPDIIQYVINPFEAHVTQAVESSTKQSGFVVANLHKITLEFSRWRMVAGAWFPTPKALQNSSYKLCNRKPRVEHLPPHRQNQVLQAHDTCFRESVEACLAGIATGKCHGHTQAAYREYGERLKWTGVQFPAGPKDYNRLERNNPGLVALNIFQYTPTFKGEPGVTPYRISECAGAKYELNLLMVVQLPPIQDFHAVRPEPRAHLIAMGPTPLSALMYKQRGGKQCAICHRCGHSFSGKSTTTLADGSVKHTGPKERLREHLKSCGGCHAGANQVIQMPMKCSSKVKVIDRTDILMFRMHQAVAKHDFAVYYDFGAYNIKKHTTAGRPDQSWSHDVSSQTANTVAAVCLKNGVVWRRLVYRGDDCVEHFLVWLLEVEREVSQVLEDRERDVHNVMTRLNWIDHNEATECYLCKEKFEPGQRKCADHDHVEKKYLGAACVRCNQQRQVQKKLCVVAHNAMKYDLHHVMKTLGTKPEILGGGKPGCHC